MGAVIFWIALICILIGLGIPGASEPRPWFGFLKAVAKSAAAIVVPLTVFVLSVLLLPDWKGACRCGWVDGFAVGKYALSPVILFAAAALYRLEVLYPDNTRPRWAVIGIHSGAIVWTLCIVFGWACLNPRGLALLTVSLYIPAWYIWRSFQLANTSAFPTYDYLWATLGMTPFLTWSWVWSHRFFDSLPDTQPRGCFVVTAAGRGHPLLVGPFLQVEHAGVLRTANRQLVRFWRFEEAWRVHSPCSHRLFRTVYNRLGLRIASRINSPQRANVVFIALMPLEWLVTPISFRMGRNR